MYRVASSDLALARRIYYGQILPVVDILAQNNNPTGTIKAGVAARGIPVGVPRKPGHGVGEADRHRLEELAVEIVLAEAEIEAELAPIKDKPFIVFHDATQYFEKRFGVPAAGSVTAGRSLPASISAACSPTTTTTDEQ